MKPPEYENAVEVVDVRAGYPARGAMNALQVLDGVSVRVPVGEVLGVLGTAGSGKSSLLRLVAGLPSKRDRRRPRGWTAPQIWGGEVATLGYRILRLGDRARRRLSMFASFVPQDASSTLPASATVEEVVGLPIVERDPRFNRKRLGLMVADALDRVRLPLSTAQKYGYELSGGQRQRVALARSLVTSPRLLIADSPLSHVDPVARAELIKVFAELAAAPDFTAIIASYETELLHAVANKALVLDAGRVIGYGTLDVLQAGVYEAKVRKLRDALGEQY